MRLLYQIIYYRANSDFMYLIAFLRDVNGFKNDIDKQIGMAASLLDDYYKKYGSKQVALDAYNLGIGSVAQGKCKPDYRKRFKTELNAFERV